MKASERRLLLLPLFAVVAAATLAQPALAEPTDGISAAPPPLPALRLEHLSADDVLAIAGRLVDAGRYAEAQALLDRLAQDHVGGIERDFLDGMIALTHKEYARAERLLRKILQTDPRLLRVRLELARVLFLESKDDQADYHFRLAAAEHPPEIVLRNIARFREALRARRAWRVNFNFGIAPDSNINSATGKEHVVILGLPFKLDADARARSGVGTFAAADASLRLFRDKPVPLYLAAYARILRYPQHAFDDIYLGGEAGPEFRLKGGRLRATGTVFERWYGGRMLNSSYGGRLAYDKVIAGKWGVEGSAALRRDNYAHRNDVDSWTMEASLGVNRALGASTLGFAYGTLRRSIASEAPYSYWNARLGVGVVKELFWGLRPQLNLEGGRQINDAPMPLFERKRSDWDIQASASLYKRDWNIAGFAPSFKIIYSRDFSTIALYDQTRWRTEFGVTKAF